MVSKILLASGMAVGVSAVDWALLVAGSNTFSNYRHQADLCNMYSLLVANGLSKDRIITMAYDDIANNADNPFPGKIFNRPDKDGLGNDVYAGCNIDYTGKDVTAENFLGLLSGDGTTGGNGRMLNSKAGDDVFFFYVDHGAPGLIQFPGSDVLHASDFQVALADMHSRQRYGKMVIYMEACESGSMLEGLPSDLGIYGVTAVGPDTPSLATYCGYDAYINNIYVGSCLGDLFAVQFMDFVEASDGSQTLSTMFSKVKSSVASYAAMHWGHEINNQYGDISMGELTLSQFFYGENTVLGRNLKTVEPTQAYSARRVALDAVNFQYSEVSDSSPSRIFKGAAQWSRLSAATDYVRVLLRQQEMAMMVHWNLAVSALGDMQAVNQILEERTKPQHVECETVVHSALIYHCEPSIKLSSAFALQFHQVVVNLCNSDELSWSTDPSAAVPVAAAACQATKDKFTSDLVMHPSLLV